MSNQEVDASNGELETVKLNPSSNRLITEINDQDKSEAMTESVTAKNSNPNKRPYLEVNSAEKYKQFVIKPIETKPLKPSATLDRVRQFLPLMKESTNKLLDQFKSNPEEVNIENVEEEDEHIEMNLALVSDSGESDEDEEEEDDDDGSKSNKLKSYLDLLSGKGGDDDDESDSDEEDDDDGSPNPLDDLNLGFKVKDPSKITSLKTTIQDGKHEYKKNKHKKQLIKIIESENGEPEHKVNNTEPSTSSLNQNESDSNE